MESRRVAVVGTKYESPTMAAYGVMKLNEEYGFYISYLKLRSEGFPEVRLIIENEQEFEAWIHGFTQELSRSVREPDHVLSTDLQGQASLGDIETKVIWDGLIDTFIVEGVGEFKVVRRAEGKAPWGSTIEAELRKSETSNDILISLPKQNGLLLAILDGKNWEIWVTPKNEIHVARPKLPTRYPPEEYLFLTQQQS